MTIESEEEFVSDLFGKGFVILDGATGTMLQKSGLKLGEMPEILNFTNSEVIMNAHKNYIEAGANIIYANTFGANRHKLEGSGYQVGGVIKKALENAKTVAKEYNAKVALDIGPIGELLEPSGLLSFEDAYDIFSEVMIAGKENGADLVVIETMTDLYEVKAAVLAAKEQTDLPVFVTMTFEENGRTFTGVSIEAMAMTLQGLNVDAIGINCSLGPKEILPLIKELAKHTNLPLIAKPNAGLPDPQTGLYNIKAKEFGELMREYALSGVKYLGGCCGTDEGFIKELTNQTKDLEYVREIPILKTRFCSSSKVVTVDGVKVIGERINPTGRKAFAQTLREGNINLVLKEAIGQVEAGANILDVNVGVPGLDETKLLPTVVKAIQGITDAPLQIDSSKTAALEAGLRVYNGKPILNSVNGEVDNLEKILPLAKKYGAAIVALTIDEDGIPKTAGKRVKIAKKILNAALAHNIPKEDILVDCLTLTVSAQQEDCIETLNAMRRIREELGLELVLGVSNISFGIPNRGLMNQTFLVMAMNCGLTLPIINPNNKGLMDAISAYEVLSGKDEGSKAYIQRFSGESTKEVVVEKSRLTIEEAILKGLDQEVKELTKQLLMKEDPLEIVNNRLIPALDQVGLKFEKGELYLPQLLRSANASCCAFDYIKQSIAIEEKANVSKGKIILATVRGDIHDIGKNIVKVILENYGYQVIDLGKDVSGDEILETAIKNDVRLIGLSALMTTTVESMKEIIGQIKKSGHDCEIMVGGAVLTHDYAMKIGANYYAKDAKRSVDIAKEVLN